MGRPLAATVAVLLSGCGNGVPIRPAATTGGGELPASGPPVAEIFAQESNLISDNGAPTAVLGASLYPTIDVDGGCAGASQFAGSCCYFPPPDGGPPRVDGGRLLINPDPGDTPQVDLGALTFSDESSGAALGSVTYQRLARGPHSPSGYPALLLGNSSWAPGDLLTVVGSGSDAGTFTGLVRAVAMPEPALPSPLSRENDLTLTWKPDPNGQTLLLRVGEEDSSGAIVCQVPDSAGTLTVDHALLANLPPSNVCGVMIERQAFSFVQTPVGTVVFAAQGIEFVGNEPLR